MNNSDNIKKLSILYFEGNATSGQEKAILEHITASEANMEEFRAWEEEWADNHTPDKATDMAWERLARKMEERESRKRKPHMSAKAMAWRMMAAAAMVALIALIGHKALADGNTQYIVCSTPDGNRTKIGLPDGTKIWLNAGSELKYPDKFGKETREVELTGEAHFDVARQEGQPFTVRTAQYDITVKGTKFDVSAYADDETVSTTLFEGRVDISMDGKVTEMLPGERVVYDKSTGTLQKTDIDRQARSWTSGDIVYRDVTLKQFARAIARQYGVSIKINRPETGNIRISVVLQNDETIDEVISALERVTNRKITRKRKNIVID